MEQHNVEQHNVEQVSEQISEQVEKPKTETIKTVVVDENGFKQIVRTKRGFKSVTTQLSLEKFQKLFSGETITYYDRRGKKQQIDNEGIVKRTSEERKDKNGKTEVDENGKPKIKYTVHVKTYFNMMGDIAMISWYNGEVSYYTKLNHPDLTNFGEKMYWLVE